MFLVRCVNTGRKYALKRMFVNSPQDLNVCKREIQIAVSIVKIFSPIVTPIKFYVCYNLLIFFMLHTKRCKAVQTKQRVI